MRLAQVMAGAAAGGAELFFERLCVALHEAGDAVLPVIRRDAARAGRLGAAGLAARQLRFGSLLDGLTRPRLRRLLRAHAPRVVVAWMNRAARLTPPGDWVLAGRLGGYYELDYYRRCDHLIGNTRGIAAWITSQGWPAARVHHLPNFVPDMAGAVPDRMGVPDGVPLIAASGRLHRNKGFDLLIRAMPRLPGAHLVIAGEGPEREGLERLARREAVADRVRMPGWLADTRGLLAACDVFACPSRHEPLGNVVLEAWAAGRPVVAAAVAGPAELIASGETGLLASPEDAEALAGCLGTVLHTPALAAGLAERGRQAWAAEHAQAPVLRRWRGFLATVEKL